MFPANAPAEKRSNYTAKSQTNPNPRLQTLQVFHFFGTPTCQKALVFDGIWVHRPHHKNTCNIQRFRQQTHPRKGKQTIKQTKCQFQNLEKANFIFFAKSQKLFCVCLLKTATFQPYPPHPVEELRYTKTQLRHAKPFRLTFSPKINYTTWPCTTFTLHILTLHHFNVHLHYIHSHYFPVFSIIFHLQLLILPQSYALIEWLHGTSYEHVAWRPPNLGWRWSPQVFCSPPGQALLRCCWVWRNSSGFWYVWVRALKHFW